MNSLANGKIIKRTGFKNIYIPSSPGDGGGAIGAAVFSYIKSQGSYSNINNLANPFLGRAYSDKEILMAIKSKKKWLNYEKNTKTSLINKVTDELILGKVGAWFQGGSEWGPRALGNRSIIADPRNAEIKDRINAKTKLREKFRPFAPSFLPEHVNKWFDNYGGGSEYMGSVYSVTKSEMNKIPAVVHADGTARLQVINKKTNERYYSLVSNFFQKTGIPAIVNTSFNVDEPIVYSPDDAISTFLISDIDFLAIGNFLLYKK